MRAVNLLPRDTTSQQLGFDHTILVGMAFTLVVAAAMAGGFYIEKANAATQRQRLATAQAALTQAQSQQPSAHSPGPVLLQVPAVLSQEQPWHVAVDTALASRVAWDVLLGQLEYVVPDKITLSTVTLGSTGSAPGAAGGTITLGGSAFSSADLATFLSTLARVPKISNVTLLSSAATKGTSVTTFQISAQMTVSAPPAPPAAATSTTTGGGA
jgi:Tfp pilus assembly protein PilN